MVGARGAWRAGLIGALLCAGEARASQPPRPSAEDLRRQFRARASEALRECSERASKDGRFGDIFIRFRTTKRSPFRDPFGGRTGPMRLEVISTPGLGKRYDACVRRAFQRVAEYGVSGPEEGPEDLRLGTPLPLLPDPARLMPLWRSHDLTGLRKVLSPDVTVSRSACLKTRGEAIEQGVQLWLDRWTRAVPSAWWPLLVPSSTMHLVGDAIITSHFDDDGVRRCLVPLDEGTRRSLRAKMDELGRCWAGDLSDILINRGVSFPAGRRYRSVSVATYRACAVDNRGALVCCGEAQPEPPAGTFTQVAVADRHACAVAASGSLVCWGRESEPGQAPPAGTYTRVAVANMRSCALARDGTIACWGNPGAVPAGAFAGGRFTRLSVSEEGVCALDAGGRLSCVKGGGPSEHAGPFLEAHAGHPCVLRTDRSVWCSDWIDVGRWGLAARPTFTTIAVSPTFGCGRRDDGGVECFGQVPPEAGPVPAGKFVELAAGPSRICGIREDGGIACWGITASYNFR